MSETQSNLGKTGARAASNAPTASTSSQRDTAANGWYTPHMAPVPGAALGTLTSSSTKAGLATSLALGGRSAISNSQAMGYHTADYSRIVDRNMKRYGEVDTLKDARRTGDFKFYDDFTKRFDQTQNKTGLRDPY